MRLLYTGTSIRAKRNEWRRRKREERGKTMKSGEILKEVL